MVGLRTKLVLLMSITAAPLGLLVLYHQQAINQLVHNNREVSQHSLPLLDELISLEKKSSRLVVELEQSKDSSENFPPPAVPALVSDLRISQTILENMMLLDQDGRKMYQDVLSAVDRLIAPAEKTSPPEDMGQFDLDLDQALARLSNHKLEQIGITQLKLESRALRLASLNTSASLLIFLLGALLSLLPSSRLIGQIAALEKVLRKMKEGSFDTELPPPTNDELGCLVNALKDLKGTLEASVVSRQYVEDIINSMSEAVVVTDLSGRVAYINESGKKLLASASDSGHIRPLLEAFPSGAAHMETTVKELRIADYELLITRTHMVDEKGRLNGTVYVVQDITKRKQVDRTLEEYRERLTRDERISALGTLGAIISHKINQPLSSVRLFLQQAKRALSQIECPDTVNENLDESLEELERISQLMKHMLAAGRGSSAVEIASGADIETAYKRVQIALREPLRRAGVSISFQPLVATVLVKCAQFELEELLYCLVNNSLQAAKGLDPARIRVGCDVHSDTLDIFVEDTCGGMPPEHLDKIFECFFTTKSEDQGTGLGLAIVRHIAEHHGGEVRASSMPGQGTRITVAMPLMKKRLHEFTTDSVHS